MLTMLYVAGGYDLGMLEIQQKKIKDYREAKDIGYGAFSQK